MSQASMSAWSCCVSTERHMSLRRACRTRRALALRDRRQLAPRQVAHLPLLALRELVEAEDARERLALVLLLIDRLARSPCVADVSGPKLSPMETRKWPRKNDAASIQRPAGGARAWTAR